MQKNVLKYNSTEIIKQNKVPYFYGLYYS